MTAPAASDAAPPARRRRRPGAAGSGAALPDAASSDPTPPGAAPFDATRSDAAPSDAAGSDAARSDPTRPEAVSAAPPMPPGTVPPAGAGSPPGPDEAASGPLPPGASAPAASPARPRARRHPLRPWLSGVAAALLLLWAAGFAAFVHRALRPPAAPPPSDGIVALTGGAGRIEAALRLLAAGGGRELLVSGVECGVELDTLARRAGLDGAALAGRVTLGRRARTTRGNAAEVAAWVAARGLRSLTVVTASYHMPRALAELGRALPGVVLRPDPVLPPALRGVESLGTLRMMGGEYSKWLLARAGLSRLLPAGVAPGGRCAVERMPRDAWHGRGALG